jgi:2-polyprenyl-3-methyl-5-hydroxy-6-metoxy-1,4-benzoquinol methylase
MSKEMWDQRYSEKEYAYGTEPNSFFKEQISLLKAGKLLLPAEGEGRNAVFAAKLGWDVTAFDISEAGRNKALELASANNVQIKYVVSSVEDFKFEENYFDAVGLIFAHFPSEKREFYHKIIISLLKLGGTLIMEAFSKEQINFSSGGPKDLDMLYSEEDLKNDFRDLNYFELNKKIIELTESHFHTGEASVQRLIAIK